MTILTNDQSITIDKSIRNEGKEDVSISSIRTDKAKYRGNSKRFKKSHSKLGIKKQGLNDILADRGIFWAYFRSKN